MFLFIQLLLSAVTFQSKYYSKYFQFINSVYLLLEQYKLIITTIINYNKLLHFTFILTFYNSAVTFQFI